MITLKELLQESLLTESVNNYAFIWNHDNPDTIFCCNGNISKLCDIIHDYDFELFTEKLKSDIVGIAWNDESGYAWNIDGRNLNDAKRKDLKYIEDQINQQKDQIEQERYMGIESNIFGGSNEWEDDDVTIDAKEIQKRFIDIIENSEVDKDSMYGRAVIDIRKGEVLLSGKVYVNFLYADEFIKQYLSE